MKNSSHRRSARVARSLKIVEDACRFESLERRVFLSAVVGEDFGSHGLVESFSPQTVTQWKAGSLLTPRQSGDPVTLAINYLQTNYGKFKLNSGDVSEMRVTSSYTDSLTGLTHVYLRQTVNGLDVTNANANVSVRSDGRILLASVAFVRGLTAGRVAPALSASQALSIVADQLEISPRVATVAGRIAGADRHSTLRNTDISRQEIPTKLQYVANADGTATLGWKMTLDLPSGEHWYELTADAANGQIVHAGDYIEHATYNVLPMPTAHPHDPTPATSPNRQLLTDPHDPIGSPFGWHDLDGVAGADTTETRGNNVVAQEDVNGNNGTGIRAQGGAGLNFDFPLDLTLAPSGYQNASLTNLFYWNNVIHDVTYNFGFNEVAGNFQTNNYGNGGLGNDAVQADGQDGSGTNNANFGTPVDGQAPRMQMFLWTAPNPDRDGSVDNRIIVHEYTHGISNRLTGGPANVNALDNIQSGGMGEGWGDYLSLLMTQDPADTQNGAYGVGVYALGEPNDGNGVRRFPYSYDINIDPLSFAAYGSGTATLLDGSTIAKSTAVHASGELWCSTLWDMTWNLINKHGYAADFSTGYNVGAGNDEGNLLAFRLVLDGMKLQPVNPSFLQARDAILAADQALTSGANFRELWLAFARRGLGFSASTPGSSSTSFTPAFDLPAALIDPFINATTPADNSNVLNTPITSLSFTFAEAMNPASFSVLDDVVSFTGPGGDLTSAISGSAWSNGNKTLTLNVNAQRANGAYQFVLAPSVLAADDGDGLDQDGDGTPGEPIDDRFTLDFTKSGAVGPRVTAHTPTGSLSFVSLSQFDLTFAEAMDQTSFSIASDVVSFTGPGGVDLTGQLTGSNWQNSTTLRVTMNPQATNGTYTLVVGPNILAAVDGAAMDQNSDGTAGGAGDTYTAAVTLDLFPGPDAFGYESNQYPFENLNLVIGQAGVTTLLNGINNTPTGTINLGAGNTFNFYGTNYTSVIASVNGLITFGTGNTSATNGDMTTAPTQASIAVLWDDWDTISSAPGATDSAVLWKLEPGRLIVEWSDVPHQTEANGAVTFQAILQLNTGATPGRMLFNYVDVTTNDATITSGRSASVGIKDVGTQGGRRLLLGQNAPAHPWIGDSKAILVAQDVVPPKVTASSFEYLTSHEVKFTFDEDVSASLSAADLVLHNNTTGLDVLAANQAVAWDLGTLTATFTVPGLPGALLDDGDYTATLLASGVSDAAGNPLDGNGDTIAGGNKTMNFFFLRGDANHDRTVNVNDFTILAGNFGQSPRNFGQGDFNYDTLVNVNDFTILAGRFGVSLAADGSISRSGETVPQLPPAPGVLGVSSRKDSSPFGTWPIDDSAGDRDDLGSLI